MGGYRIVDKLAEGGMGQVYRAHHPEKNISVAVKILRPSLRGDRQLVRRLSREAEVVAGIRHPGIVDIIDYGLHGDGNPYVVMEYLRGETLRERLTQRGELPMEAAVTVAKQIAGTLIAVHGAGIVHRDLKPENIFLTGDQIKLLDFGIAQSVETGGLSIPASQSSSIEGRPAAAIDVLMGTLPYISPEQCRTPSEIDHRADLYALGVTLFEMICGCRPFVRAGPLDYVAAHLHEIPPSLADICPRAPAALSRIVARLLAKEPGARFPSANAVLVALEQLPVQSGQNSGAVPEPVDESVTARYAVGPRR